MFEPLIVLGLFGALVWVISQAIFMLLHADRSIGDSPRPRDTLAGFVAENYGSRFDLEATSAKQRLRSK